MVLGVQWLTTLGPVFWDFKDLRMEFQVQGKKHVLRGGQFVDTKRISATQTQSLLKANSHGVVAQHS